MAYLTAKPAVTCPFGYASKRKPSPWAAGYHPGVDYKAFFVTVSAPADAKIIHAGSGGWRRVWQARHRRECGPRRPDRRA